MGLLDMFDDPGAQLGLGLLGAASPRADGAGFGQRLMEGVQGAQAMRNAAMQRQMQQLQMQQAQQKFGMMQSLAAKMNGQQPQQGFTPTPTAAGASPGLGQLGNGTFGIMQPSAGQDAVPKPGQPAQTSSQGGGIESMSPTDIAMYKMFTGEDLSPIWKIAKEGFTEQAGQYHRDAVTGKLVYNPDPVKGVNIDQSGKVSLMPGAVDTQTQLATIPEAAKDQFGFTTVPDGKGGTQMMPSPMARASLTGGQTQSSAPILTPQGDVATLGGSMPSAEALQNLAKVAASGLPQAADAKVALALYQQRINQNSPFVSKPAAWGATPPAAQLEADKANALAGVKQATEPQLSYSTQAAQGLQKMGENINNRLAESQDLLKRITQSRQALTQFKAGGGTDSQASLAQAAQAFGAPQPLVDKIAGGNLAAVQEFQKYAAQEALQTMQQSLASDNGPAAKGNRIAMELFIKNNPNITTDPRAIEKIFDFQTKLHNDALKQSDFYSNYVSDPSSVKDATIFGNKWAHQQLDSGMVVPKTTTPAPSVNQPTPQGKVASLADIAATAKASGKSTAQVTADLRRAGFTIGGQ